MDGFIQEIYAKVINSEMPMYKSIRGMVITEEPLIKTTTGKVKRYEELKKVQTL